MLAQWQMTAYGLTPYTWSVAGTVEAAIAYPFDFEPYTPLIATLG